MIVKSRPRPRVRVEGAAARRSVRAARIKHKNTELKHSSLLQKSCTFVGLFCNRDLYFSVRAAWIKHKNTPKLAERKRWKNNDKSGCEAAATCKLFRCQSCSGCC